MLKKYIDQWENTGNIAEPTALAAAAVAFCFFISELLRIIL